jgi:AAA family ATP:ADP antiporter
MIAFLILISNFVNTTGEYILGRGVQEAAAVVAASPGAPEGADKAFIGKFYADFFTIVGFVGLVLQLLVVSRILKYFGVKFAIMALPVIALGTYLSILIFPILAVIRLGKTAENATDYSLNNTVRQILFLPTTKEEKYKAKVAIDSFFVRAGDVLSAGLVFVGVTWLSFNLQHFATVCLCLVVVWLFLAFRVGKENKKLVDRSQI